MDDLDEFLVNGVNSKDYEKFLDSLEAGELNARLRGRNPFDVDLSLESEALPAFEDFVWSMPISVLLYPILRHCTPRFLRLPLLNTLHPIFRFVGEFGEHHFFRLKCEFLRQKELMSQTRDFAIEGIERCESTGVFITCFYFNLIQTFLPKRCIESESVFREFLLHRRQMEQEINEFDGGSKVKQALLVSSGHYYFSALTLYTFLLTKLRITASNFSETDKNLLKLSLNDMAKHVAFDSRAQTMIDIMIKNICNYLEHTGHTISADTREQLKASSKRLTEKFGERTKASYTYQGVTLQIA